MSLFSYYYITHQQQIGGYVPTISMRSDPTMTRKILTIMAHGSIYWEIINLSR